MRKLFIITAILLANFSISAQAGLCILGTFDKVYKESEVIISGTASKVAYMEKRDSNPYGALCGKKIVTFKISKIWKGKSQEKIDVFSEDGCSQLGSYFEEGKEYLVYIYPKNSEHTEEGKSPDYEYETGHCVRTTLLDSEEAQKDIILLKSKQK